MSMGIFDRPISVYNGVKDVKGIVRTLRVFLNGDRYAQRVQAVRSEHDEEMRRSLKNSLPAATISGVFHPVRGKDNLVSHSGLLCIDIDGKDNPTVSLAEIRRVLASLPYVAYAALSVGGNGMFAIIPIENPDRHVQHFESLRLEFDQEFGIVLDRACKDTSRLRIMSYDPDAYINEQAETYTWMEVFETEEVPATPPHYVSRSASDDLQRVMACCNEIERRHIDITGGYMEWSRLGMSLSTLGEAGRYPFHIISRQSPKYRFSDTDKRFTSLLKQKIERISLNTFFFECAKENIRWK